MATIDNLCTDVERIGGIDSSRYTDANKMISFTNAAHIINEEIMQAMADTDFQGEIATHNLVASQREYLYPSDFFKIKRIDLKLDGTNWRKANWLDESEIGNKYSAEADIIAKFTNDDPYVSFLDESFFIWSGTITNVTGGIKITYNKEIVGVDSSGNDLTAFSATTDVPTLKLFARQALVYWAIIDWYLEHPNKDKVKQFNKMLWGWEEGRPAEKDKIGGIMRQIINYYQNRSPDREERVNSVYQEEDFN